MRQLRVLGIMFACACAIACHGRTFALVIAHSTLSAGVQVLDFPTGIELEFVNAFVTFGGASGSGNHDEWWTPAESVTVSAPDEAVFGFQFASGHAESDDPFGESHMNSIAFSNQLRFINTNAAAITVNLGMQWAFDLQVTIGNASVDTGDAGYLFRVRNLTTSTTLAQRDLTITSGSASSELGFPLELIIPAESSVLIDVEGQVWADAYTVPAPSAGFALIVHAIGFRARRRSR